MIGRRSSKNEQAEEPKPRGFDDFELRLGDVMRGERATMGKSLLDVQRELRIKASYIAAIENCDPGAFDTPGFIAGYVRSYARYLDMDPEEAFGRFCAESGFQVAHGMSAEASGARKPSREERLRPREGRDMFDAPATPFVPTGEALLSRVEPGAIGSALVLVALISAIGFGGWTVLKEVQKVQVVPVEQSPVVLSDLDPIAGAGENRNSLEDASMESPGIEVTRGAALDRLYRPQALDVPVLVARDAPIATLDPRDIGAFSGEAALPSIVTEAPDITLVEESTQIATATPTASVPRVVESLGPTIRMVATSDTWVRIQSAEGNTLYEATMRAGDSYDIPAMEVPPKLRTGNSGAVYFAMGTDCYGPVGASGEVTKNISLERYALVDKFKLVDPADSNSSLNRMFATIDPSVLPELPCKAN